MKVYFHLMWKQLIARIILTQIWSTSLAVIEILSFSCSALLLVTANSDHLGMPNCKKSKRLHTRNILAQNWINTNQWFLSYRHFHCLYGYFATILSKSILDDLEVLELLSVSCSVLFLVKEDGDHFEVPNCKKSKLLNAKIIITKSGYNSIERYFQFYSLLF